MSKNKIITLSVFTSRQEEIHRFLKKQDANVTSSIWDALERVYWLPALFDAWRERAHEIDELEKIEAAIDTIFRLEGELIKAKLLARKMGIDYQDQNKFSAPYRQDGLYNDRSSAIHSQTDSSVEPEGLTVKKSLPTIAF